MPAVFGHRGWLLRAGLVFIACYATGRIGLATPLFGAAISPIWAPAGIALAAMLRLGLSVWPAVWLAALALGLSTGSALWLAVLIAFGNTLGPLLGAWVLQRDGLHTQLDRRRDLWLFGSVGIGFSMAVTASNGTFWLAAAGHLAWRELPTAWLYWWLGDAMGALVVGIPLLTLTHSAWRQATHDWRWLPTLLIAIGCLAAAALTTLFNGSTRAVQSPLFFLPHLLLCWLAVRSGLFAASVTGLLLTTMTVACTLKGIGPFHLDTAPHGISMLVGYVCSLLAIPTVTSALTGEIKVNEQRWQLALDASNIGVGEWDLRTGEVQFSRRWLALLGHASQVFGNTLQSFWTLVHPDDVPAVRRAFEPLHAGGAVNCRAECRMQCRDGSWRLFELHALVAERAAHGEPVRIVNTARDISDVQAARDGEALSQSVFQHLHEGLLITDAQHRVLEANPTFSEITGYARQEVLGIVPPLLLARAHETELRDQLATMKAALEADGSWRGELRHHRRNGEPCVLQITVTAVRDAEGEVRNHVLAIADVTHARAQFEQLQRQAHFDELTRLPNRVRLAQMLQSAMETSRREGSLLTVCYLDLDHFKPVNDRSATRPAIGCCSNSPTGCAARCVPGPAATTWWRASAATNSCCCCALPRWRRAATPSNACCSRSASPTRSASAPARCWSPPASAPPCSRSTAPTPRPCCATPTTRCTAPSRPAATATCSSTPSTTGAPKPASSPSAGFRKRSMPTSSGSTSSPRSTCATPRSRASRRCCAGSIPSRG